MNLRVEMGFDLNISRTKYAHYCGISIMETDSPVTGYSNSSDNYNNSVSRICIFKNMKQALEWIASNIEIKYFSIIQRECGEHISHHIHNLKRPEPDYPDVSVITLYKKTKSGEFFCHM